MKEANDSLRILIKLAGKIFNLGEINPSQPAGWTLECDARRMACAPQSGVELRHGWMQTRRLKG